MKLSVGTKIGACSGLALLALIALGLLAHTNIKQINRDTLLVSHAYEVVELVDHIQIAELEAETAQRAYLLEGQQNVESAHQLEDSARQLKEMGANLQEQMGRYTL